MKIDVSAIKWQLKGEFNKLNNLIRGNWVLNNKLLSYWYSIIVFIFIYNIYTKIYWYSYLSYTLWEHMSNILIVAFISYLLGHYVLSKFFNTLIVTIADQLINLIAHLFRKFK